MFRSPEADLAKLNVEFDELWQWVMTIGIIVKNKTIDNRVKMVLDLVTCVEAFCLLIYPIKFLFLIDQPNCQKKTKDVVK